MEEENMLDLKVIGRGKRSGQMERLTVSQAKPTETWIKINREQLWDDRDHWKHF